MFYSNVPVTLKKTTVQHPLIVVALLLIFHQATGLLPGVTTVMLFGLSLAERTN